MTTLNPALPETYVVEVNPQSSDGFTRTPVLAWLVEDKRPLPVTLHGKHTLSGGEAAVEFPGGMVHHPSDVLAYDTVEAWLESAPGTKPLPPARSQKAPAPEEQGSVYDISWGKATYATNSFWHYDDGEYEFVFQIDKGVPYPVASDKLSKIKRDEFMVMKKEIDALTLDAILNAEPLEIDTEENDDDDDDDDADDLI